MSYTCAKIIIYMLTVLPKAPLIAALASLLCVGCSTSISLRDARPMSQLSCYEFTQISLRISSVCPRSNWLTNCTVYADDHPDGSILIRCIMLFSYECSQWLTGVCLPWSSWSPLDLFTEAAGINGVVWTDLFRGRGGKTKKGTK